MRFRQRGQAVRLSLAFIGIDMKEEIVKKITCMSPQLLVSDLEKSIRFYTEELGFSLNFRYADFYAGIDCNGHSIHLKLAEVSKEERKRRKENGHLDITFGVLDIEDVFEEVATKDVEVIQRLREMPYGREFYITDPDGHVIGFFGIEPTEAAALDRKG